MYKIAIVDDHTMLRKALESVLSGEGWQVPIQAANGLDFINWMETSSVIPDVILLDIAMPLKNGFETCIWLQERHPEIKILAITMNDDEASILQMLRLGAKGYISKNADLPELKRAIVSVLNDDYYFGESGIDKKILHASLRLMEHNETPLFTTRELEFLRLNCSDLSYKEIAGQMHLSPRTVENYRDALFQKFEVKSRLSLALLSIKKGWVKI